MFSKYFHFPKLRRRDNYSLYSKYVYYRQEIREDCLGRCVYCDIHENELGGSEFMTLDHFKPKDKYPHLKHIPQNLVWSCSKCNSMKSNIWPGYGTPHTVVRGRGFIDPFVEDLKEYFDVLSDGELVALKPPAQFIIRTLLLNRSGIKIIRELRNKKYDMREKCQKLFMSAMQYTDDLLANPDISEEERQKVLAHKRYLEEHHEMAMKSYDIDFNLYS